MEPYGEVLEKLLDTIASGVGGLLLPWQVVREATARNKARYQEGLMLEKLERDLQEVRAGTKMIDENFRLVPAPTASLQEPVQKVEITNPEGMLAGLLAARESQARADELERTINLVRIVGMAEEEAEQLNDDDVSPDPVDPDWLNAWRQRAENVTKEQLARLWAHLLARETKQPGSYSLHTLDFLSRLSPREATVISRVSQFRINNVDILRDEGFLAGNGVTFDELLLLESLGILVGLGGGGVSGHISARQLGGLPCWVVDNNRTIAPCWGEETNYVMQIPVCALTHVGRELLSLVVPGPFPTDEYLRRILQPHRAHFRRIEVGNLGATGVGGLRPLFQEDLQAPQQTS